MAGIVTSAGAADYSGLQFGVGVPILAWPASSINWFVGYANKEHPSFWGKRFGFRADFATPLTQESRAHVYDENNIHVDIKVAGISRGISFKNAFDPVVLYGTELDLSGVNARVGINDRRFGGLVDFYPFGNTSVVGGFRFSGGYYIGQMNLDVRARNPDNLPQNGVVIDIPGGDSVRTRLQAGSMVRGRMNWRYSGPYGGIGWDIGVYRGFKFFFDAGVISTYAPKLYDRNVEIPYNKIQACFDVGNAGSCNSWVNLDIDDIPQTTANLAVNVIDGIFNAPGGVYNGIPVGLLQAAMVASGLDINQIATEMAHWVLAGGAPPSWYVNVPPQINTLIQNAIAQAQGFVESDVMRVIDEYHKTRTDIVRDVNRHLRDLQLYPIFRLGVMYRF